MAFWITSHMKAKREQKKEEQIVIKLFTSNYARDLFYNIKIYIPFLELTILHSVTLINITFQNQIAKLDLLDYFSQSPLSSLSVKDKNYNKIVGHLDEFIKSLQENDRQILLKVINKSYLKYQNSITNQVDGNSIYELIIKLFMAI